MQFMTRDLVTTILPAGDAMPDNGQSLTNYRLVDIMGRCTRTQPPSEICWHSFPTHKIPAQSSHGFGIESHRQELRKQLQLQTAVEPFR